MNKKVLLFVPLFLGSLLSFSQQESESSSKKNVNEDVNYGVHNETYNKYETSWSKNKINDNLIISLGGGAQVLFGEDDSKGKFKNRITFAPQFSVTKYFAPAWGLRLNFSGGSLHGFNDGNSGTYRKWNHGSKHYLGKGYVGVREGYPGEYPFGKNVTQNSAMLTWDPQWNYLGFRLHSDRPETNIIYEPKSNTFRWNGGDFMDPYMQRIRYFQANIDFTFDVLNFFSGYDSKRFFEVSPFAGLGLYNAFAHNGSDNFLALGGHGGFILKFRVTERLGLNAEFSGSILPDDFDGQSGDNSSSTGIAQAIASVSYKIGKTNWDIIQPMDYDLINTLNTQINDLRDQNKQLMADKSEIILAPPVLPVVPVVEQPVEKIKFLPDPVFFGINKATIDNEQWDKIDKAATWLANHPSERVILTGYADERTGSSAYNMKLSERRAKAVAEVLVQRYNINPLRISISWSGSEVQPFNINNWNRVVVFVIE